MKKIIRREIPENASQLHSDQLLNRLFAARAVKSTQELNYELSNLLPYKLLSGIDAAVAALFTALSKQQSLLIIGDFDADGATSTALAMQTLKDFGLKNIKYLIPNRFEFGYGLTPEIVAVAAKDHPDLIMTVDNGISSLAGVEAAKKLGIGVLITDHHLPANELPIAVAIVNPNQPGDIFPSKNLAGVGVVFYLMLALRAYLREVNWFSEQNIKEPNMAQFLDLVALGTIADVVPLDWNNRILVSQGTKRIQHGKCSLGIKTLLAIAKHTYERVKTSDLAYIVAPRINAAGRLDDMSLGIECLLTNDLKQARLMAQKLDSLNSERREIENDMQREATRFLDNLTLEQDLPLGLCVFEENWHQGVLGVLASKLKDRLHRPVIAFTAVSESEIKGSARSIASVHIRDVLSRIDVRYPGVITKFGGHAMAAGLCIKRDAYETFVNAFLEEINKCFDKNQAKGVVYSDGELPSNYCNLKTAELLQMSGPWGHAFPEPVFDGVFDLLDQRLVGQRHLKMLFRNAETAEEFSAIYFNADLKLWPNYRAAQVKAAYRLDVNEYNHNRNLQLLVEYLEPYL